MNVYTGFLLCSTLLAVGDSGERPDIRSIHPENSETPIHVIKHANFKIPIMVDPARRDGMAELRLFVSRDRGKTWRQVESVSPDTESFKIFGASNGEHWFTVQVVGKDKRKEPKDPAGIPPGLKVRVEVPR